MQYKIVGPCTVAGVRPGGTVSHDALVEQGANVKALLGYHLQEVKAATPKPRAKRSDA